MRSILRITHQILEGLLAALLLAIAYAALAGLTFATPDRKEPPPPKKAPAPPPFIGGPCNWGAILQEGRKIEIRGHCHWEADGRIRADGKLAVYWTRASDGAICPALYVLNADGSITGHWGVGTEAEFDDDGNLVGRVNGETVRAGKD